MEIDFSGLEIRENLNDRDAKALLTILDKVKIEKLQMVEVGCWKGFSTAYLASHARDYHGTVYAVDHWQGNVGADIEIEAKQKNIYSIFEFNMKSLGLWDCISPIIADSLTACRTFTDESIDLVFLDADHRYKEFKQDLMVWYPKVKPNGIICGHDCENYYTLLTDEQRGIVNNNLDKDSVTPIHPGVIKALNDQFGDNFTIINNSIVWYKQKRA